MNARLMRMVVGAIAAALIGGVAVAQQNEEVTVQATRAVKTTKGTSLTGIPITTVEVSYTVSAADLNLALSADAAKLEQRVKDTAMAACKEIHREYPFDAPNDAACAKTAADAAMVKVHALVLAAAGTKPTR